MRGVLHALAPGIVLADISHDVPPQNVLAGGFTLAQAARWFPAGAVHLAVVDPGVGSSRRAIAVEAGGHAFVGPDNGLLWQAVGGLAHRMVEINPAWVGASLASATFHGRDLFAPAAAALARGVPLREIGAPVTALERLDPDPRRVLSIDRFGNVISAVRARAGAAYRAHLAGVTVDRFARTFADAEGLMVLAGSAGLVEVARRDGSAAATLGVAIGDPIAIEEFDG
jgi:hypothetical protein